MLIAHRGVTSKHVENTFEALTEIMNFKQDQMKLGVEFDVQQLKDGEIVIYHDKTLERLHNDKRIITDIDKQTATKLNITFFEQVLNVFQNTNFLLDVEIKYYDGDYKKICNSVANMIIDRKMEHVCFVTSFNFNIVMFFLKQYPSIKSHLIVESSPSKLILEDLYKNGMKGLVVEEKEYKKNTSLYSQFEPIIYCINHPRDIVQNIVNIITDKIELFSLLI